MVNIEGFIPVGAQSRQEHAIYYHGNCKKKMKRNCFKHVYNVNVYIILQ
jgi:hypothetical protein